MIIRSIHADHTCTEHPTQSDFLLHTHDGYELLYFVRGDADYAVEGNIYHLRKGDMMLMRKLESHYLILRSSSYYERLAVHFDLDLSPDGSCNDDYEQGVFSMLCQQPLGKYNRFSASLFPDNRWLYYMNRICSYHCLNTQQIYLPPLLHELSEVYDEVIHNPEHTVPNPSTAIVAYINEHLFENLSLEKICAQFFLSRTQLNRIFKQTTGSTVWNYIVIKRLFCAREMMQNGETPTTVFEKCGFRDYVTFYKAYLRHFGHMPKMDYRKR